MDKNHLFRLFYCKPVFFFVLISCFVTISDQFLFGGHGPWPEVYFQYSSKLSGEVPTTNLVFSEKGSEGDCRFQLKKNQPPIPPPGLLQTEPSIFKLAPDGEIIAPIFGDDLQRQYPTQREGLLQQVLKEISPEDKIDMLCDFKSFAAFQKFTSSDNFTQLWANATIENLEFRCIEQYSRYNTPFENNSDRLTIENSAFSSSRLRNLKSLTIFKCKISQIDKDAFRPLENLENLIIGRMTSYLDSEYPNPLSLDEGLQLPKELLRHNTKLKEIVMINKNIVNFGENGGFFDVIPQYRQLTSLDLSTNWLIRVTPQMLFNLTELNSLILRSNTIFEIDPLAFESLGKLTTLDLSGNKLAHIDRSVFSSLSQLTLFKLNDNLISTIDPAAFQNLGQLTGLTLQENRLAAFPRAVVDLKKLTSLHLEKNSIRDLVSLEEHQRSDKNDRPIAGLSKLTSLSLQSNNISRISPNFFQSYGMTSLEWLYLYENHIDHLDPVTFETLKDSLEYLTLSSNRLKEMAPGLFTKLTKLTTLYLENNQIEGDLTKLDLPPGLDNLDVANNRLTSVTSLPPGLHFVNLSNNTISSLSLGLFSTMATKRYPSSFTGNFVDLSNNLLTSIARETVEPLGEQEGDGSRLAVKLAGNPWTCDCRLSWINIGEAKLQTVRALWESYGVDASLILKMLRFGPRDFDKFVVADLDKMYCQLSESQKRNRGHYDEICATLLNRKSSSNDDTERLMCVAEPDFVCEGEEAEFKGQSVKNAFQYPITPVDYYYST